ncbi:haloalkane dehalogenase-like [Palaemon carinicauda]|uniref:haloalkane dehalogenase-like n=1 Tax=Palaemon carinicauda TaxID=392227 RepID=UPI0035B64203
MLIWSLVLIVDICAVPYVSGTLLGKKGEPVVVRTPESRFSDLAQLGYPWEPKYAYQNAYEGLPPLRVHYIDEGPYDAPETLLLLHGTPAWSFLYRTMIPVFLKAGYRVVAVDNIGFGRSDKLTDPDLYTHELHVKTVAGLVRALDLQGVTLVAQDLGGPTGLGAVARDPSRYRRLALLNTWLPQGDILSSASNVFQHIPYLSWRTVTSILGRHVPVKTVFTVASDAPKSAVHGGYKAPFPSALYKAGPAKWPLIIPLSIDDPVAIENQRVAAILRKWEGPVLIAYSDREVFTISGKRFFESIFPYACTSTIQEAGHFLQEDQGPAVAQLILKFMRDGCY